MTSACCDLIIKDVINKKKQFSQFKFFNLSYNSHGFTLIELLVAAGIASVVVLACGYLINNAYKQYISITNTSDNIVESQNFSAILKNNLSLAVSVDKITTPVDLTKTYTNIQGVLSSYEKFAEDWVTPASPTDSGLTDVIFVGFIDYQKSGSIGVLSDEKRFLPAALFFQRPTIKKYGVISLYIGTEADTKLSPDKAQFKLDQIVDFKIDKDDIQSPYDSKVSEFSLMFTRRNFKNKSSKDYVWCPPLQMNKPECSNHSAYFDTTEFVNIKFRNLYLRPSQSIKQRKTGSSLDIEFEGVPERLTSGVFFMKPVVNWGALKR